MIYFNYISGEFRFARFLPLRTMEHHIHHLICRFIATYYPETIFTTDLSGIRIPMKLAKQIKPLKSSRGIPDLIILKPIGGFHGLCLEIKIDGTRIHRIDGELVADQHIREQHALLIKLNELGYAAFFVIGLDAATACIEKYMSGEIPPMYSERSICVWTDSISGWCDVVKID